MSTLSWLIIIGCLIILSIIGIRITIIITDYKSNKLYRELFGLGLPKDIIDHELGTIEEYLKINSANPSNFEYDIYSLMFENEYFIIELYRLLNKYNYDFDVVIKVDEVISTVEFICLTDNN